MSTRTAVIYTRVSSREQEQEGFSLDAQTKLLRTYAERNGFEVVRAFEDVETAKATGRKQFGEMVTYLKHAGTCRVLLVEKTDRLYRNFKDAVTIEELKIEVHLVKEGQSSPNIQNRVTCSCTTFIWLSRVTTWPISKKK